MLRKPVLDYFFKRGAIAVVGASPREGSIGCTLLTNLKKDGFPGAIYPINPKHVEILGLKVCLPWQQWGPQSIWLLSPSLSGRCLRS